MMGFSLLAAPPAGLHPLGPRAICWQGEGRGDVACLTVSPALLPAGLHECRVARLGHPHVLVPGDSEAVPQLPHSQVGELVCCVPVAGLSPCHTHHVTHTRQPCGSSLLDPSLPLSWGGRGACCRRLAAPPMSFVSARKLPQISGTGLGGHGAAKALCPDRPCHMWDRRIPSERLDCVSPLPVSEPRARPWGALRGFVGSQPVLPGL